ncbi:type VI secretion system ATPase TssH [Azospirillum sp. ST 5-10]|uniref:type VI secretion system ATPase TssH n=1 Tax=unclassified Azospirillum TaxID=2630922 RepID=UPI003F4A3639
MINVELKPLLGRLNRPSKQALEGAAGACVSRGHYEVTIEHMLARLVEDPQGDVALILRHFGADPARFQRSVEAGLERLKAGNGGKPVFSPLLVEWFADAWLLASIELRLAELRSGVLLLALLANPRYGSGPHMDELAGIAPADLKKAFFDATAGSREETVVMTGERQGPAAGAAAAGPAADSALARFTINFTERARKGEIDPVFCRDAEIRQIVDILGRRRKNNPIAVGEPGVGKTAVVEGLALKIVEGDVPDFLKGVELLSLDMGLLQAGAGVKGEFENRLKGVIDEIKGSPKPLVIFIDEAHTLIGAGGQAGGSDAANLLKPALARGELRTVAATTWSEYKKYFEKDPALARRFQLVKLDEPSPDQAVTIIRGLRDSFEKAHGVLIRDDAVVAAARLAARYITGRQLPDKAVDVLDTAAARVKLALSNKPAPIDDRERRIRELRRELDAIARDVAAGTAVEDLATRSAELEGNIAGLERELADLNVRWENEKAAVARILELRRKLGLDVAAKKAAAGPAAAEPAAEAAAEDTPEALQAALNEAKAELARVQDRHGLIDYEVTPVAVSKVIADWTGIPVGSMVKDEAQTVLGFKDHMLANVKGQDHAIEVIDQGLRAAKAGLNTPTAPMGVFLLVGPSGVGKTETATRVAELMFGGERFMVTVNMSEFQEKASVSRLIGSAPGYVGYGEGGQLTEAVRQRPYSVVLLDECEKADLEVMNLFYQVFDKGTLNDGEGREIDFKNTIMFLTSNLATEAITELGLREPRPTADEIAEAVRPILSRHFKPALLARMSIVPYFPLRGAALGGIVRLKLDKLGKRLASAHRIAFSYSGAVVQQVVDRCTEVETGARNIDFIINRTLLPQVSTALLERLSEERLPSALELELDASGGFQFVFRD